MVKTPKMRHSKSHREPVTIELEPGAVSRIVDEGAAKPDDAKVVDAVNDASQLPEEPVHADQVDLEPWEHTTDAAQAGAEKPAADARTFDKPEQPYPSTSEAPASVGPARAFDYGFDDASSKPTRPNSTTAKTETRDETMAPTSLPPKRGGINGIAAGIVGGVIALVGAGGLQFAGLLGSPGSAVGGVPLDGINGEKASL
jgi:hypothetical protein